MKATEISWCLPGRIEDGYLITEDGEKIKIRDGKLFGSGIFQCVPVTSSTGEVVSLLLKGQLDQIEPSFCVGRVTQITRRGTILVKVTPSRKITFYTTEKLTLNEVYKLEFEYRNLQLHVLTAAQVDAVEPQPQPRSFRLN